MVHEKNIHQGITWIMRNERNGMCGELINDIIFYAQLISYQIYHESKIYYYFFLVSWRKISVPKCQWTHNDVDVENNEAVIIKK